MTLNAPQSWHGIVSLLVWRQMYDFEVKHTAVRGTKKPANSHYMKQNKGILSPPKCPLKSCQAPY